jgi:hypothetical protein
MGQSIIKNIRRVFAQNGGGGGGVAGSGTTNYIPKWTPDGFTLGDSLMQDNGSGVGVNSTPLANTMFGAKGIDSTSSNFAGKFVASDDSVIAAFRNDKNIEFGGRVGIGGISSDEALFITNTNGDNSRIKVLNQLAGGAFSEYSNANTGTSAFLSGVVANYGFLGTNGNIDLRIRTNSVEHSIIKANGDWGIGTLIPTSKFQVVGLPTYLNNAAALLAGLTAGAMYIRTGHGLDIVV